MSVVEVPEMPVLALPHAPLIGLFFWSVYGGEPPIQLIVSVVPLLVIEVIINGERSVTGFAKFEV